VVVFDGNYNSLEIWNGLFDGTKFIYKLGGDDDPRLNYTNI